MFSVAQVAYYDILGLPVIVYLGILTLSTMLFTASIPVFRKWKIWQLPLGWHYVMARITITFALLHGLIALLVNLGF